MSRTRTKFSNLQTFLFCKLLIALNLFAFILFLVIKQWRRRFKSEKCQATSSFAFARKRKKLDLHYEDTEEKLLAIETQKMQRKRLTIIQHLHYLESDIMNLILFLMHFDAPTNWFLKCNNLNTDKSFCLRAKCWHVVWLCKWGILGRVAFWILEPWRLVKLERQPADVH